MKNNSRPSTESNMTEAALAALREQGFSRRQFLKGSGALVVAFSVAEFADKLIQQASASNVLSPQNTASNAVGR